MCLDSSLLQSPVFISFVRPVQRSSSSDQRRGIPSGKSEGQTRQGVISHARRTRLADYRAPGLDVELFFSLVFPCSVPVSMGRGVCLAQESMGFCPS